MSVINVVIMIHGMTTDREPGDHQAEYDRLWNDLIREQPALSEAKRITVEWGHETPAPTGDPRLDQRLTRAENFIHDRVSYDHVRADQGPNNHVLPSTSELLSQLGRRLTVPIKETVLILGAADAFYYCAPDGERAIRATVYEQFLQGLEDCLDYERIGLHIIAHSLGVTVAYDFLFGLFAPDELFNGGAPNFLLENQGSASAREAFAAWRQRAQDGRLVLASKSSTAGQLPLFLMRKQSLVDKFAAGERLDASVIGLRALERPIWKIFYDVDDVLGFPARRLFEERAEIEEFQVDTGWRPDLAHGGYWAHPWVKREMATLIAANWIANAP
jgi:hypothetical protein